MGLIDAPRAEHDAVEAVPRKLAGVAAIGDADRFTIEPEIAGHVRGEGRRAGVGRCLECLIDEERRHKLGPHRRVVRRHSVEDRLVGGKDVGRPFSRQKAAVDLEGAAVGDEVHLHAPADQADVAGGRAEEGMTAGCQGGVHRINFTDERGRVADGIDPQMGLRRMGGPAVEENLPPHHPLRCHDNAHLRRLGDDGRPGLEARRRRRELVAQACHAAKQILLVDHRREPDVAGGHDARSMDVEHRVEHPGEAGLRVARAAAVHPPAVDRRSERGDRHAGDADDVHVSLEHDLPGAVAAGKDPHDIVTPREDLRAPRLDPRTPKPLVDVVSHAPFAGAAELRIHAVDADEIGEGCDDGRGHDLRSVGDQPGAVRRASRTTRPATSVSR